MTDPTPREVTVQLHTDRTQWAREIAQHYNETVGTRFAHVQAVAQVAASIASCLPDRAMGETLVAAAWVHDIGYHPDLDATGFHPLDGARWLARHGHPDLAALVAHHSGARYEAQLRGIPQLEQEFPYRPGILDQALTFSDMTTSPTGEAVSLAERARDIEQRYGPEHVVTQTMRRAYRSHERDIEQIRQLVLANQVTH